MKLPSVARCRLDQRRFVAQAVMQPRGDVEPRLDCRLRIGDQFGPEIAAGVGDAEDERPGTRSNGLGEAHALQAERSEEHKAELQSLMSISYAVLCLKKRQENA